MSQENVENLRAAYDAFERGDLEEAFTIVAPEIAVADHDRTLDSAKEYRGHEGIAQMVLEAAEPFDNHRYEPEQFTPAGNQVLVRVRRRGRGKASGIEVDELQWHLWEFVEGKARRVRGFVSEAEALEAAGLSD